MEFQSCSLSQTLTVMSDGGGQRVLRSSFHGRPFLGCPHALLSLPFEAGPPTTYACSAMETSKTPRTETEQPGRTSRRARTPKCIKGAEEKGEQTQEILTSKRALQ
ncbi:unnamed protein product [Arctogadus glacialis]